VIITRTPLRITLGGGGTDVPSYYERFGGLVLSAAINRYVYIAINRTFTDDYFLKYANLERVKDIDAIEHPIIREALRLHPIGPAIELVSVADIPASTGLGSSGTFTVGLLRAIYAYLRQSLTTEQNAAEDYRRATGLVLAKEGFFYRPPMTEREREWLSKTRTADAAHWNLLADMRPEQLSYVR